MATVAIIVGLLIIALGVVYYLGRNNQKTDDLLKDVATGRKTNETLQKQRDDRIDSVDLADKLWSSHNQD